MDRPPIHGKLKSLGKYSNQYPIKAMCGKVLTLAGKHDEGYNVYIKATFLEDHVGGESDHGLMRKYKACQACLESPNFGLMLLAEMELE